MMTTMNRHMRPALQLHAPQGSGKGEGISTHKSHIGMR